MLKNWRSGGVCSLSLFILCSLVEFHRLIKSIPYQDLTYKGCSSRQSCVCGYDASQLFAEWQVQMRWAHPDTEGIRAWSLDRLVFVPWRVGISKTKIKGAVTSGALKVRVHPYTFSCMRLPWQTWSALKLIRIHTLKKKKKKVIGAW